ncbi:hypothetical protein Dvar_08500 [Desulfosarcina variabilis str. Montpellier]|uniref:hypothetical protein n=1 Tax=Desulfosarcina variabilis TaxID=2300 RepID=UPI003AFAA03C
MSCHFTYVKDPDKSNLCQGDVLRVTEDISSVLKRYHPHYFKSDYIYFIVLTQSCDLVRRDGKTCSAKYITLASVRPFDVVLNREVKKIQSEEFEIKSGICRSNRRNTIESFTTQLLNNNQKEFFYLHEDDDLKFPEPCCAFLRLSIALRANDHYDKCLDAKHLQLTEEFRAKLGWLVGNLYSRVGTMDWVPDYKTKEEFKEIVNSILESQYAWFQPDVVTALKKQIESKKINVSGLNAEDIKKMALEVQIPTKEEKKKTVLKSIGKILSRSKVLVDDVDIDQLLFKIESDPTFKSNIK